MRRYYAYFDCFVINMLISGAVILLTLLLRRRTKPIKLLGPGVFMLLYALCGLRMLLPDAFGKGEIVHLTVGVETLDYSALPIYKYMYIRDNEISGVELSGWEITRFIWLGVAAVLLARLCWRYLRSMYGLSWACRPANKSTHTALAQITRELGGPRVEVFICPAVQVPMGAGILRRRILLPKETYSPTELTFILRHEYAHFKHWDPAVKLLTQCFCHIFWWNPLSYLLCRDIEQLLEIRADRAVTRGMGDDERTEYMSVLMKLLRELPKDGSKPVPAAPLSNQVVRRKSSMVERFRLVADSNWRRGPRAKRLLLAGKCLLAAAAIGLCIFSFTKEPYVSFYSTIYLGRDAGINPSSSFPYGYIFKHSNGTYTKVTHHGKTKKISQDAANYYIALYGGYGYVVEGFSDYLVKNEPSYPGKR